MSKIKKIISVILVATMLLSVMPVIDLGIGASAEYENIGWSAQGSVVSPTVTAPACIRVAQGVNSYLNGNKIVATNAYGMPAPANSAFTAVALGDSPTQALSIQLKLKKIVRVYNASTGTFEEQTPVNLSVCDGTKPELTVSAYSGTAPGFTTLGEPTGSGSTWTWAIPTNATLTATAGSTLLYTIKFKVGTDPSTATEYTTYGTSRVDDITSPAGYQCCHGKRAVVAGLASQRGCHITALGLIQAKNMWSTVGFANKNTAGTEAGPDGAGCDHTSDNGNAGKKHCIVNFSATGADRQPSNSSFFIWCYGGTAGSVNKYPGVLIHLDSSSGEVKDERSNSTDFNVGYANDRNRGNAYFYRDLSVDTTLESIGMKYTIMITDTTHHAEGFKPAQWAYCGGYAVSTQESQWKVTGETSALNSTGEWRDGLDSSYIWCQSVAEEKGSGSVGFAATAAGNSKTSYFTGSGPRGLTRGTPTYWLFEWEIEGYTSQHKDYPFAASCNSIRFFWFQTNKADLRGLVQVINGQIPSYAPTNPGNAANYDTATITPENGITPIEDSYTAATWSTYLVKYKAALAELNNPRSTNQTSVETAYTELRAAYEGLQRKTGTVVARFWLNEVNGNAIGNFTEAQRTWSGDAGMYVTCTAPNIYGYTLTSERSQSATATSEGAYVDFIYTKAACNIKLMPNASGTIPNYPVYEEVHYNDTVDLTNYYGDFSLYQKEIVGWYNDAACTQGPVTSVYIDSTAERTYYAKWAYKPVHLNYELIGAGTNTYPSTLVQYGGTSVRPADPQFAGYGFLGWFADSDLSIPYTFGETLTADKTIYGSFVAFDYKVKFNTNGGTAVAEISTAGMNAGDTVNLQTTTKAGYDFAGWYYDSNFHDLAADNTATTLALTADTVGGCMLYAKWNAKTITINFAIGAKATGTNPADTKNDEAPQSITGQVGASIAQTVADSNGVYIMPNDPVRYGYDFVGWRIASSATTLASANSSIPQYIFNVKTGTFPSSDSDVTLYPVWRPSLASATLSIDTYKEMYGTLESASTPDGLEVTEGDIITVRMTPTTNFFAGSMTFVYMYDNTFFELVGSDGNTLAADGNPFVINSENSYGAATGATAISYTGSNSAMWPAALSDYSTNYKWIQVSVTPDLSTSLKPAKCDGTTWLVEFKLRVRANSGGATGKVFMDNAWTRTGEDNNGIQYIGWCENANTNVWDSNNKKFVPIMTLADSTVKYKADPDAQSTITADPNGGTWADTTTTAKTFTGDCGEAISGYTSPTWTGHSISAWKTEDGTDTWVEGYYGSETNNGKTFKANWVANKYNVIYDANGGSFGSGTTFTVETDYDSQYTVGNITLPTKQGYVVTGWATDAEGTNPVSGQVTMDTTDDTYYAIWGPADDTNYGVVLFYADATDDDAIKSETISLSGYTDATVHFVADSSEYTDTQTDIYVAYADVVAESSLGDYYEVDADDDTNTATLVIAPDGSAVATLNLKAKTFAITYDLNGGSYSPVPADETVADGKFVYGADSLTLYVKFFGDTVAPSTNPTKEGFQFGGWTDDPDYDPSYSEPLTADDFWGEIYSSEDVTYYAIWNPKSADVIFNANGGTFGTETTKTIEVEVGKAISKPSPAPTRPGYSLVGYGTSASATTDVWPQTLNSEDGATYWAIWTPALQNVTVNAMYEELGGTYNTETSTIQGLTETNGFSATVADFERTGFTYDAANSSNSVNLTEATATTPAVITLKFTRNSYILKFKLDGGNIDGNTADVSNYVKFENSTTDFLPSADPEKEGFTFTGWSPATIPGNMPAADTEFTAQYTRNNYLINFYVDLDGEGYEDLEPVQSQNLAYEATITPPQNPTKTGYTFRGWAESTADDAPIVILPTDNENYVAATVGAAPKNYYAVITVNQYDAKFMWNDGEHTDPYATVSTDYGAEVVAPATDPVRYGYTFGGWANLTADTVMNSTSGLSFNAIWNPKSVNIVYMFNGGTVGTDTQKTAPHNFATTVAAQDFTPTRTGYTFGGWVIEGTDTAFTFPKTIDSEDTITLVAQWTAKTNIAYKVTTLTQKTDGTTYDTNTVTKDDGVADASKTIVPTVPDGFELKTDAADLTKTIAADGSTVFTVTLDRLPYTLLYKYEEDGETFDTSEVLFGADVVIPSTIPEKTGYTFDKWNWPNGTKPATMPANDVTAYASWTVNSYRVKFNLGGGNIAGNTADVDDRINYGAPVVAPTGVVKTGYTPNGWSPEITASTTMPAEDTTYTAQWTANSYTATFLNADGTEFDSFNVDYDSAIVAPEVTNPANKPVKAGYTFQGWSLTDTPRTVAADLGTMNSTDGRTFYPVFTADEHDFYVYAKYENTDGTFTEEVTHTYQGTVDAAITPVNTHSNDFIPEGYTSLDGFTPSVDSLTGTVPATGSLELRVTYMRKTAKLTINPNRGTFTADNSTESKEVTLRYEETYTLPAVTRSGYTHNGWTNAVAGENNTYTFTMGLEAKTATAQWLAQQFDVTWDANGGYFDDDPAKTTKPTSVAMAATITDTDVGDPFRAGYTFVGWNSDKTAADAGTGSFVYGTQEAGGRTFYAAWQVKTYRVTFNLAGGNVEGSTEISPVDVNFGADINAPTPVMTGYDFNGWSPAIPADGKMPALEGDYESITYTAQWADGDADYKVYTYVMNTDGTWPAEVTPATVNSTTNTDVDATPSIGTGFTLDTDHAGYKATGKVLADSSLELRIYIKRNQYTFKTVVDGVETPTEYYFEQPVTDPGIPEKVGYTFHENKWFTESACENEAAIPATMPYNNVTVYGKFDKNTYTITYMFDGEAYETPVDYDFDEDVVIKALPTKTGYTVSSAWTWTKTEGGAAAEAPTKMPAYNLTATATATVNTYTITYLLDGEAYETPVDYDFDEDVVIKALPTKTGYTVSSAWTWTKTEGGAAAAPTKMPAYNLTAAATSTVNSYKLSFTVDGVAYGGDPVDVDYGTPVSGTARVLTAPTKAGYTFSGWQNVPETMPAADTVITGTFTADGSSYEVEVYVMDTNGDYQKDNNKSYTVTENVVTDQSVSVTAPNAETGFTYEEAISTTSGTVKPSTAATPLTLKLYYSRNQYPVTFISFEGQQSSENRYFGSSVAAVVPQSNSVTRTGYTFNGWALTDAEDAEEYTPASDTVEVGGNTYYARWTVNSYTISFVVPTFNEVTHELNYNVTTDYVASFSVPYGTSISSVTPEGTPTVNDYFTFNSWNTDGKITMPADNLVVKATFDRVDVDLSIKGNSTTIVDSVNEEGENKDEFTGYVYGLQTKLTETGLRDNYVAIDGDGYYVVTPVAAYARQKLCGTGATIELYDNLTKEVVKTYYVVIFGDINGDSSVSVTDQSALTKELTAHEWSIVPGTTTTVTPAAAAANPALGLNSAKVLAADLNNDGNITSVDVEYLAGVRNYSIVVDQTWDDGNKSKKVTAKNA